MDKHVTIIGAGLAGCEAAWQLAEAGLRVTLIEMKPHVRTAAARSDFLAELVCSNSLRSQNPNNAVGCLKQEMAQLGSLIVRLARQHRVPAGDALAVDRQAFGEAVTGAMRQHPNIALQARTVEALPAAKDGPCIVATGPLTADALAHDIQTATAADRLYFYDALAPIISADSVDRSIAFAAARWGKGDGDDYLNCPLDAAQYAALVQALLEAECMPLHAFEAPRYFQGCQPVEVIAASGPEALRFGPLKPVGLFDPRDGRRPYAVVQLRLEDTGRQAYNLVGFQTKMKLFEQKRVLRLIPGLHDVEILRYGAIHRNTYLDSPSVLDAQLRLRSRPHLRFAGQITGVEGYVESAACGLMVGRMLAAELAGPMPLALPPLTCAVGALLGHVRGACRMPGRPYEPQNVNWSMVPPLEGRHVKADRKAARLARAEQAFAAWAQANGVALQPCPPPRGASEAAATPHAGAEAEAAAASPA